MQQSRREFLKTGAAALAAGGVMAQASNLFAQQLKVPLGLQLYSLRDILPSNLGPTLKQVAALGYRDVEAAGYYNYSGKQVAQAMRDANLNLVSAHYPFTELQKNLDAILEFNNALGVQFIICSTPGFQNAAQAARAKDPSTAISLDDWRWNAEQFNDFGQKVSDAGMRFGYHNHIREFRRFNGIMPYDELMHLTEPALVTMEMDCGWVYVGGGSPAAMLEKYPTRISMLHVKNFRHIDRSSIDPKPPIPVELGRGEIDYTLIFHAAAETGNVKHIFVEQEAFDMPPMASLKMDADYLRKLGVV